MSQILDSGNRREFDSGAVRDIAEGKGRMDLIPLDIASDVVSFKSDNNKFDLSLAYGNINRFCDTGDPRYIHCLIWVFANFFYQDIESCMLEVSIHYEEGAKKYAERNWEKGIPCHCYVDSALRHITKFCRGDKDEHHDRAFIWNLLGLLWTARHKPELNDL